MPPNTSTRGGQLAQWLKLPIAIPASDAKNRAQVLATVSDPPYPKQQQTGAQQRSLAAKVLTLNAPGSHMDAGSNPSIPAPCLGPGNAAKDGPNPWALAPVWETQKRFQAPRFGLTQLQPLQQLVGRE